MRLCATPLSPSSHTLSYVHISSNRSIRVAKHDMKRENKKNRETKGRGYADKCVNCALCNASSKTGQISLALNMSAIR